MDIENSPILSQRNRTVKSNQDYIVFLKKLFHHNFSYNNNI
jgi:hypothetical protein